MKQLNLVRIASDECKEIFISELQQSFQLAHEAEFGKSEKPVITTEDIQESFDADGAEVYFAEVGGERVGGVVVAIDQHTDRGFLDLLYVKPGV